MSDKFDEMARECCKVIIDDLSDRRGLRQEWEQIDDDVQLEIRGAWSNHIAALVRRADEQARAEEREACAVSPTKPRRPRRRAGR